MHRRIFCQVTLLILILATGARAVEGNRLTIDLYLDWEWASSQQISPDGSRIVFTRRWTDKVNDKYETDVWIMNADGSRKRFLVKGSQPVWSPDGTRLAYIAAGQPSGSQIFVKWMDTGEETQLTRLERSPSNLKWSPDGKHIAFNMLVPAKAEMRIKMPDKPDGAKWVEPPRVVDRLNYRSDQSGFRTALKMIVCESGSHCGSSWLKSPSVNWRGVPPVSGTTKMCSKPSGRKPDWSER